jgi:hypothetical protein
MRTFISELTALAALLGGVDEAARETGIDEEVYQRAVEHGDLSRLEEAEVDRNFAVFLDSADDEMTEQLRLGDALFMNLTDRQIDKIFTEVTGGGYDFRDALDAFERDDENIGDVEDSEFWAWFREFYDE